MVGRKEHGIIEYLYDCDPCLTNCKKHESTVRTDQTRVAAALPENHICTAMKVVCTRYRKTVLRGCH